MTISDDEVAGQMPEDADIRPLNRPPFDYFEFNTDFNVDNPHSDQGFDVEKVIQIFRDQVNEISAQTDAATSRRNDLLEAILNELKGIRQDQVIIKEALLYAPGGPGADQARQSFEAHRK